MHPPSWIDPALLPVDAQPQLPSSTLATLTTTGQLSPRLFTTAPVPAEEPRIVGDVREALKEITWPLILTGLAIGVFTGLGTTVGSALGTMFVERVIAPAPRAARGRRR